ncbi:phenylethanolamine N-methyltransferase-like [Haliotis rufescens]|uniref:phenylethanolamine N-methyltransferase-like n=1 Tax=Haliotis rufescens TaxID=6454 RepID=UPI00201F2FD6|nr:phenylethanolamine N-methyltransferase-like [Haliotis rufescens]
MPYSDDVAMNRGKFGREDYLKYFDSAVFLKTFHSDIQRNGGGPDALEDDDLTGRRLLDIGTGPTIHTVISASNCCDTIYLSKIAPQNRETLRKWLEGTLQHSFKSFFQYVVDREGKGEIPSGREAMLKDKIVGIFPLDLLQAEPLLPSLFPTFDIITSSLCIEVAAPDLAGYEIIARSVGKLLKEGGHIALFGVLGGSFYQVGSHTFYCLKISGEQVQDIWKRSGFKIVGWKQNASLGQHDTSLSDFEGVFHMVAQKCL